MNPAQPKSSASQASPAPAAAPPPSVAMLNLIIGYWVSQMIFLAAKLGLADHLKDGPKSAAELARTTRMNADGLYRLLRGLASVGVFAERADGRFELTPLAATLDSKAPGSMRAFALMIVEAYNWDSWKELAHSVETGEVGLEKTLGMKVFEYLDRHPDHARVFGESMSNLSAVENPAIVAAYDFSRFQKIIDVGGGHGSLLAAILSANPKLTGILYDNPRVVENARKQPHMTKDVAARMEIVGGDFFEKVPSGADAHVMKYIMHDWNEELAVKILSNCKKSIAKNGRLLIVDTVIPPGNDPHWGKLLDLNMMVLTGGLERTEKQFGELLSKSGFELVRVVPTQCALSIVEAKPA